MFSLLGPVLGQPLKEILASMPFADDLKDALLGVENAPRALLDYVTAHERAEWEKMRDIEDRLGLAESDTSRWALNAVVWAESCVVFIQSDD
jgi:c-di-GMP-related signal transduction protein